MNVKEYFKGMLTCVLGSSLVFFTKPARIGILAFQMLLMMIMFSVIPVIGQLLLPLFILSILATGFVIQESSNGWSDKKKIGFFAYIKTWALVLKGAWRKLFIPSLIWTATSILCLIFLSIVTYYVSGAPDKNVSILDFPLSIIIFSLSIFMLGLVFLVTMPFQMIRLLDDNPEIKYFQLFLASLRLSLKSFFPAFLGLVLIGFIHMVMSMTLYQITTSYLAIRETDGHSVQGAINLIFSITCVGQIYVFLIMLTSPNHIVMNDNETFGENVDDIPSMNEGNVKLDRKERRRLLRLEKKKGQK